MLVSGATWSVVLLSSLSSLTREVKLGLSARRLSFGKQQPTILNSVLVLTYIVQVSVNLQGL